MASRCLSLISTEKSEHSLGISKQSTIVVFKNGNVVTGDTQYDSLSEILRRAIP